MEENEEENYMFSIDPNFMEMQGTQDFEFFKEITSIVRVGAAQHLALFTALLSIA